MPARQLLIMPFKSGLPHGCGPLRVIISKNYECYPMIESYQNIQKRKWAYARKNPGIILRLMERVKGIEPRDQLGRLGFYH